VIDIAATVVDTLASSFEYIKRADLVRRVRDKLDDLIESADEEGDDGVPPEVSGATATLIQRESTVAAFCARRLRRSVCVSSRLRLRDAVRALAAFCARKRRDAVSHKDARTPLTVELGEMTTTSCNGVRNFWRGWELLR